MTTARRAALYPSSYRRSVGSGPAAVRLFGSNWGFGVILDDKQPLSDGVHTAIARQFWCERVGFTNDADWLSQNILAVDVGIEGLTSPTMPGYHSFFAENYQRTDTGPLSGPVLIKDIKSGDPDDQFKKCFQLVAGRIESLSRHANRKNLIASIRTAFALDASSDPAHATAAFKSIFLYADGFAIFGSMELPWAADPLEGWFKVTTRGAVTPGAPPSDNERGLCLCLDPDLPSNAELVAKWDAAASSLASLLAFSKRPGVAWLSPGAPRSIFLQDFFWPGDNDRIPEYFTRAKTGPLVIEAPVANVRLHPSVGGVAGFGTFEIGASRVQVLSKKLAGQPERLIVGTYWGKSTAPPSLMVYEMKAAATTAAISLTVERLRLGAPDAGGETRLDLAIPLVETARMLRDDAGMPERPIPQLNHVDPVGPLWTFSPIDNGLIHWPFPDATLEGLELLLPPGKQAAPDPTPPAGKDIVSGSILIGNRPDLPGFKPGQRPWSLAITNARGASFALFYEKAPEWTLVEATIGVAGFDAVLDGAVQVTPFRQTAERLLPDHDERALRTRPLRAVTPSLLRGLEADMWEAAEKHAGGTARAVQAKLSLLGLTLLPERVDGRAQFVCTIRSRADQSTPPRFADPQLRPWLWTRGRLPAVQTLPLAISGPSEAQPSGTRELHPFIRAVDDTTIRYSFENALDFTVPAPKLIIDNWLNAAVAGTTPLYIHPLHGKSLAGKSFVNEIGMASLTLPSLTWFPDKTAFTHAGRTEAAASSWPLATGISAATAAANVPARIELRHDLALRDEYYAIAAVGDDPAGEIRRIGRFIPLPANGPQDDGGTSWAAVWLERNRQAALAATEGREMVIDQGKPMLANLRGSPLAIKSIEIDEAIGLSDDTSRLDHVGRIRVKFDGKPDLNLVGLPDPSDLAGLSGRIAGTDYSYGTATVDRGKSDAVLSDQGNLRSGPVADDGPFLSRTIGTDLLVSTREVLTATSLQAGDPIRFWFADVPAMRTAGTASDSMLDPAHNHLDAFRWSIEASDDEPAYIPLGGCLCFEPLQLGKLNTDTANWEMVFPGRIMVRIGKRYVSQRVPEANGGLPILRIKRITGTGAPAFTYAIGLPESVTLRLAENGPGGGRPPLLKIERTTTAEPLTTYQLEIDLLGRPVFLDLVPTVAAPGQKPPISLDLTTALKQPPGAALWPDKGAVMLTGALGPVITIGYGFSLLQGQSKLAGRFTLPLEDPHAPIIEEAKLWLGGTCAEIELAIPSTAIDLSDSAFLLRWDSGSISKLDKSWLDLFPSGRCRGATIATIAAKATDPWFAAGDMRLEFELDLFTPTERGAGEGPRLTGRGDGTLLLYGKIESDNELELGTGITHHVAIRWDGEPVSGLGPETIVAAHVIHRLEGANPASARELPIVQSVTLSSTGGARRIRFDAALVCQRVDAPNSLCVMLPGQATLPDGAVPVASTTATLRCWKLPALSNAMRQSARGRLARAFGRDGGASDGWASRLMQPPTAETAAIDAVADDSAILAAWLDASGGQSVEAYSLASGFPVEIAARAAYSAWLAEFAEQLSRCLIAAPAHFLDRKPQPTLRLYAPDINRHRIVQIADLSSMVGAPLADQTTMFTKEMRAWLARVLADAAPWADGGIAVGAALPVAVFQAAIITRPARRAPRPRLVGWPLMEGAAPIADPRRVPVPHAGFGSVAGYLPMSASARLLRYEPAGGALENEPALAANALLRGWQLARSRQDPGPASVYSRDRIFSLTERDLTSFRARIPASGRVPTRLSQALPVDSAFAAATVLYPNFISPSGGDGAIGAGQSYAPARSVTREIAPRPGVLSIARLGLDRASVDTSELVAAPRRTFAMEVPFVARAPRPPLLALNDRPRASAFEASECGMWHVPQFVLYGPRSAPPDPVGARRGLDREPLAAWAGLGTVDGPERGVIDARWNGRLKVRFDPLPLQTEAFDIAEWAIDTAVEIDGRRFVAIGSPAAITRSPSAPVIEIDCGGLQRQVDATTRQDLGMYMGEIAQSTEAIFELRFEHTVLALVRIVRIALPVTPRDAPQTYRPLFLRFEDPEFDDRLELIAHLGSKVEPSGTVAAAETPPAEATAQSPPDPMLVADRAKLRPIDQACIVWRGADCANLGATIARAGKLGEQLRPIALHKGKAAGSGDLIHIGIVNGNDLWDEQGNRFVLLPHDLLMLSVSPPGSDGYKLDIEISEEALLPINPAAFALLQTEQKPVGDPAFSAPLYVQSPAPGMVELVDPADLLAGIARFRVGYRWRLFVAEGVAALGHKLQKIGTNGSTYISNDK